MKKVKQSKLPYSLSVELIGSKKYRNQLIKVKNSLDTFLEECNRLSKMNLEVKTTEK